jgi:cbb3-type cytochrome oxidase maturation protein
MLVLLTSGILAGSLAALWWAVKSRQFSDPGRCARLPLESGYPMDEISRKTKGTE